MVASTFSPELFARICERIASGESLRTICKGAGMPHRVTFLRWVNADEERGKQYSEALMLRAENYFDEIIDIADSKADPQKTRVQIDARKWVLARMNPKKYGDKFTQELTGADGGQLVVKIVRHGDEDA
ncbi:terminase small subunit-like protein [Burkholderia cepacia]|uniref:terminase small subunit-like protein n=1 Tax=Burkholderia cepacia TaxID=292 RepID=UPI001CF152F0|nr:hypothetical protein [Burkholderia cepacia]MCA8026424.1 hypothetical protein [Burkholderia cepacia]